MSRCRNNFHETLHIVSLITIYEYNSTLNHGIFCDCNWKCQPDMERNVWINYLERDDSLVIQIYCMWIPISEGYSGQQIYHLVPIMYYSSYILNLQVFLEMFNVVHIHEWCPLKIAVCPSLHMTWSITTENIPTKSDIGQFYPFSFSHYNCV